MQPTQFNNQAVPALLQVAIVSSCLCWQKPLFPLVSQQSLWKLTKIRITPQAMVQT
jgi:hypothetical protein